MSSRTLGQIHFGLVEKELQRKYRSLGNFRDRAPMCGNGNFHAHTTRNPQNVSCELCKELLAARPHYLEKV